VVAGTAGTGPQDDCRVPAHASRRHNRCGSRVGAAGALGRLGEGEWVAIDGSKFQAVSSVKSVREREALERYLEQLEQSDEQDEVVIDPSAVADALEKLRQHREPEVGFMRTTQGFLPAYNVQVAVDAEHALIVVQQVTVQAGDNGSLQPMAEAAQAATGGLRSRSTWLPMRATRMESRPKPARLRASCRMCLPIVA